MSILSLFPYAVAVLDLGAAIVYFVHREWALGLTWLFYSAAAITLGSVK